MNEALTSSIKKILVTNLFVEVPEEQIGLDDGLQSVIGLDSVGFLELRVICEDQFGIRISDEDFNADSFRTVNQLASLISNLRTAQGVTK
ncbi:acyl carrier protein [Archangium gephyra]|uniref:Acyl carrier protein n=1 Tax=Archangium gephyra TaxID=48 RepID=A0AAC8TII5_9BACT|nr:acyl carrier protein [Archangium gephyra]AKJ06840.1 coronafacic acid synthetase, acyl carrier protein component [Archangium gephyra]REG31866.1 acyl carrier protein [Archangium gephyra]HYO68735.1 acyl carrier protein [Archangium sp.]